MKPGTLALLVGLLTLWAQLQPVSGQPRQEKVGVCPDGVAEEANCTVCQSDSDCEDNLKCCQASCGWSCQMPNAKPGWCPRVSGGIPSLGLCRNQCKMDMHCPGAQKCCMNGCGKEACVTPIFSKDGA
uniref:WAP domain-containing protein n=1 Tax=Pelusios castaneus TaxID=367368 RepID=A0A8C8S763_9SAUR